MDRAMSIPSQSLVTVARWEIAAHSLDAVLALVAELRRRSLEEPGCLGYDVFESIDPPGSALLLIERYRDAAALDAHRGASYYRELVFDRILPMLAARRVEILRPRDVG